MIKNLLKKNKFLMNIYRAIYKLFRELLALVNCEC